MSLKCEWFSASLPTSTYTPGKRPAYPNHNRQFSRFQHSRVNRLLRTAAVFQHCHPHPRSDRTALPDSRPLPCRDIGLKQTGNCNRLCSRLLTAISRRERGSGRVSKFPRGALRRARARPARKIVPTRRNQARTYLLNQSIVRCQARSAAALL